MFLVTGITGHVGGATAQNLLDQGHQVRALVRDRKKASAWAEKGVELVEGDLNDAASIAVALRDVDGAFLMLPPNIAPQPGFPEARAIIASYVEAVRRAQPARLVVLSSIGSEKPSGLGLITATHLLEEGFASLSLPVAFIRAGSFFENSVPLLGPAAESGVFYTFFMIRRLSRSFDRQPRHRRARRPAACRSANTGCRIRRARLALLARTARPPQWPRWSAVL